MKNSNTTTNAKFLMPVICLDSGRIPKFGVQGEKYFIDRLSIYIDGDGDSYGMLYNDNKGKERLANVLLKRFMSI